MKKNTGRIWKNKRGDDMLIDFWAIIVFAVILLLFFLLFAINKGINDKQIKQQFVNKDVNFMLESFLRAPALTGTDSSKTVGEIIAEDATTGDFADTNKLFEAFFNGMDETNGFKINAIQINIIGSTHKDNDAISKNQRTWKFIKATFLSLNDVRTDVYFADTYIPGYESKIYVKLSVTELVLASELKAAADAQKLQVNS